jgi:hypothetical protein
MRIFTIAFFLYSIIIDAQQFSYWITDYKNGSPSAMIGVPGDQFKSAITFSNTSSGNIYIHVKRTQKSIPLYWSLWYHHMQAKSPAQDTITLKLSPFSASVLTLHFKTDSVNPGVATASFKMYQIGFEDDAEGFDVTASTIKPSDVGIRTGEQPRDIHIFPNPANQILNITATKQNITAITIYDALGVEKFNSERVTQIYSVDISEYPAGVYFVKVIDGNTAYINKIIKN